MSASFAGRVVAGLRGPAPVYLVAAILARLGAIVLIPLYTRKLTPGEYGDFAVAQSILAFLPLVFTLGLISAVTKVYFAERDRDVGRASAGAVSLWLTVCTAFFTAITIVGVLVFAPSGGGGLMHRYELLCVCVAAAGSAVSTVPDMLFRAEQRPYAAAAYQLFQFSVQLGLGLLFVLVFARGLRGAIEALAVANVASGSAAIAYIVFSLRGRFDTAILRSALPFALPFMPHFIANWLQIATDRWTMKAYHLETALGGYVLAAQLTSPIMMMIAAWNDVSASRMGQVSRSKGLAGVARSAPRVRLTYFLVAATPAVAIVAALPLASMFVGAKFHDAIELMPLMAVCSVIEAMYFPNSNLLFYASRSRVIASVTVASAVLNISMNVGLVPIFGMRGALAARFVTAVARTIVIWAAARVCLKNADADDAALGAAS